MTDITTSTAANHNTGKVSKTVGYYMAFIGLGLVGAMLGPALPALAQHTHSQIGQISALFVANSVGYLIGSFMVGRLYDRWPGHPLIGIMLLGMAASIFLVPLMPALGPLLVVMFMVGLTSGSIDVGANTLLVWVHQPNIGPFMNGLHFFFGVGTFITPIIISQLAGLTGDITWGFWILALLIVPAAVWVLRLPSPVNSAAVDDRPAPNVSPWLIGLLALLFFLYVGAEISYGNWVFTYSTSLNLANESAAALLTSLFWGSLTAGRLLSIPIAVKAQPGTILLVDMLGCVASVLVVLLWPGSIVALWIGTIGAGAFMASIFPTLIAFAEKRMAISGKVTGYFFVGASLGGVFLPWVIGQLFSPIGPGVVMSSILIDLLLTLGVFAILIRFSRRMKTG